MNLFKESEPQPIAVKGHQLKCPVCGNVIFRRKRVLLNTRLATFFDLDWANRTATCYSCSDCAYIFWFLGQQ
jgi:predicted nucleic-acid-binding Zn-ribbon protein